MELDARVAVRPSILIERAARLPSFAIVAAFFGLGLVAFALNLDRAPFYHLVEGDQSLLVQHIVNRGEWVFPLLNGDTLPSKPLLFNWLAAIAAVVAGDVTEATMRMPSAVTSAAGLAITYAIGRRLVGPPAAVLGGLFLLTTPLYAEQAREATTDAVLAFCFLSAFALFYAMLDRREWYGWRRFLFFLAIAGAVMTKGPVGLVLPLVAFTFFMAWERDVEPARRLLSGVDKWLVVAIPLSWYGAATIHWGTWFLDKQLFEENLNRISGVYGLPQSPFALIVPSLAETAPWSLFLVIAIARRAFTRSWTRETRYLACWWATILVVFSLSVGKRVIYLLPLAPPLALLAAGEAWRLASHAREESAAVIRLGSRDWRGLAAACLAAVVLTGMARFVPPQPVSAESFSEPWHFFHWLVEEHPARTAFVVALAIVTVLAALGRARERDWREIPAIAVLALVVFYVIAVPLLRDHHKEIRSVKAFALQAAALVPPDERLFFYRYGSKELPGYLYFYFRRDIPPSPCKKFGVHCPPGYYLMWEWLWHEGDPKFAGRATAIARSADTAVFPRYEPFVLVRLKPAA